MEIIKTTDIAWEQGKSYFVAKVNGFVAIGQVTRKRGIKPKHQNIVAKLVQAKEQLGPDKFVSTVRILDSRA